MRRIETLKDGTDAVGNRTRVKVVKNKVAPPFKQAEFDIVYGQGISREGSLIDVGVEQGLIRKSGAWYTYEGDQLGQGKENVRSFLRDNPDLADEIEKRIKEKLGIGPRVDETGAPVDRCRLRSTSERRSGERPNRVSPAGSLRPVGSLRPRWFERRRRTPGRAAGRSRQELGDPESVARTICLRLLDQPGAQPGRAGDDAAQARACPTTRRPRVLDRFTEVGLIDDAALARRCAGAQHRERGSRRPGGRAETAAARARR